MEKTNPNIKSTPTQASQLSAQYIDKKMNNWQEICNVDGFVKWAYNDTPYRVVAHLREQTGHWEAIFTSIYPGTYLIRGNAGGGNKGRMIAVASAKQFMRDNQYGCPPPTEYNS